jgi:hypothetical protein
VVGAGAFLRSDPKILATIPIAPPTHTSRHIPDDGRCRWDSQIPTQYFLDDDFPNHLNPGNSAAGRRLDHCGEQFFMPRARVVGDPCCGETSTSTVESIERRRDPLRGRQRRPAAEISGAHRPDRPIAAIDAESVRGKKATDVLDTGGASGAALALSQLDELEERILEIGAPSDREPKTP